MFRTISSLGLDSNGDATTMLYSYPLIVYVHVPKTGGTTVNKFLRSCTHRGLENAHYKIADGALFREIARAGDWVSGHLGRDDFARNLIWVDRPIEYFATIREPTARLTSELNYSFERFNRPSYSVQATEIEKAFDAEVMATNFSNPKSIINLLSRFPTILNMQARFVIGDDFSNIPDEEFEYRVRSYTHIATSETLSFLYQAFGFATPPRDRDEWRENISKPHFDPSIMQSNQMTRYLARKTRYDKRLYDLVSSIDWTGRLRKPFRSVYKEAEVFTDENFDEQTYLNSNFDVAVGVKCGVLSSGRDHFDDFGIFEQRRVRLELKP